MKLLFFLIILSLIAGCTIQQATEQPTTAMTTLTPQPPAENYDETLKEAQRDLDELSIVLT